jgi:hypothetical protein
MPNLELRPISLDRARNRLAYDIKTGATETLRHLHSKLLAEVEILDKDLAALDVSMTELEAGYAKQDSQYKSDRKREVARYGATSSFVSTRDTLYKLSLDDRLPARQRALAISEQMDKAFENYLDGGFSLAELKALAEAGIGLPSGMGPLTVAVEIFKSIDKALDRLGAQREQAEQYALKLEILTKLIESFASMFRTQRELVLQRLDEFSVP